MPDVAVVEDYGDRRRHSRRSVYRTAELMLRGARDGVGCTVVDESHGGVQVELRQMLDLPEELMIRFSDMAAQLVRRCWSSGRRAGYQYVVPAERAAFVAFNDFIHISRGLLELAGEPVDLIYPAERIHALLRLERDGVGFTGAFCEL